MTVPTASRQGAHRPAGEPLAAVAPALVGELRQVGPAFRTAAAALAWFLLGIVGLLLDSDVPTVGHGRAIFVLSGASLLFGLWVYWRHGGTTITAIGVYNFAFALFVGFAGLHLLFWGDTEAPVVAALAWCYFGQVSSWLLFWTKSRPPEPAGPVDPTLLRRVTWIGVLLACGGSLASLELTDSLRHVALAAGFVGALMVAIGLLSNQRRPPLLGCLLGAGAFLLVVATSTSFGRLSVGSLGLALLVVLSRRLPTRLVKASVIVVSAPTLLMFGEMRKEAVRASRSDADITGAGLDSVASPLEGFAALLAHYDAGFLASTWGHTFWAALVSLTPRTVWPTKPVGLGAELVPILSPELANSGHSHAALFQGEWLYNFGVVGLVLMVPLAGLAVWAVDRFLARATTLPLLGRHALVAYASAVVIAAGLPDLLWVGTFTFAVRTGMRLVVVLVVVCLLYRPRPTGIRSRQSLGRS